MRQRVYKEEKPQSNSTPKPLGIARLGLVSFLCGCMVMVLEMTGSRMLAPYLGTSIIVWTSLIGIVLASLSIGYWFGGMIADQYPKPELLAQIIFGAAIVVAIIGGGYTFILEPLSSGNLNLYLATVLASILLFSAPAILLGAVSPFIARLAISDVASTGMIVGRLYALSSIGSILGTFLGGFVLITVFKTGTILFLIAIVLALSSLLLIGFSTKQKKTGVILSFLPLFLVGAGWYQVQGDILLPTGLHWDTPYNHITVYDSYNGTLRSLQTDPGRTAQSHMLIAEPARIVSQYLQFHDLAFFLEPDLKKVLVIGGGGYALPKHLLVEHPDVEIDVVEIDRVITTVARDFFFLKDDPRLHIYHEDARRFLRRKKSEKETERAKYDLVFGDAFNSHYNIPFHLTTKEYMLEVFEQLSDRGIFMTNIIASVQGEKHKLFQGFYHALATVFPTVEVFLVHDRDDLQLVQNIVLAGYKNSPVWDANEDRSFQDDIAPLRAKRWLPPIPNEIPALRDSFAPVEYYTLQ